MIPSPADVVARFRRALDGPARGDAFDDPDPLVAGLLALHRNNLEQWQREDVTRAADVDDSVVAAAKRAIDALNATRHGLVEAVDAALVETLEQDPSASPVTESPGMVYDRLSVLTIRIHYTEAAARAGAETRDAAYAARLPLLHEQLAFLRSALDATLDDVRAGRKRFVPYRSLKLYGPADPGSATRA